MIILASRSPRREKLLKEAGYKFKVEPSHADELQIRTKDIKKKVMDIAKLKAETVAARHKKGIILAADTLVYFQGEDIGQQPDRAQAKKILKRLLGKTHEVYTGICIIKKDEKKTTVLQDHDLTKVTLKKVDDKELSRYVNSGKYEGKAGAYNIDDPEFKSFIKKIDGSYTNIVGLPMEKIKSMLKLEVQ